MHYDTAIASSDTLYPKRLKAIRHTPKVLYIRGNAYVLSEPCIAIVGTRKASGQGKELAHQIAFDLAKAGLVIVSGLAQGIDGVSHQGAVDAGGKTIAVIASSLEDYLLFPTQHKSLARDIGEKGGAIVSEYKSNQPAFRGSFVQRNRIINGLSLGVLVVEAPLKSGAMITASCAKKERRLLFAVPGFPFSENAKGTNSLIKTGAYLVQGAGDILEVLEKESLYKKRNIEKTKNSATQVTGEKGKILKALQEESLDIDNLSKKTKVEISLLLSMLTELELEGLVKNVGGGVYMRV